MGFFSTKKLKFIDRSLMNCIMGNNGLKMTA